MYDETARVVDRGDLDAMIRSFVYGSNLADGISIDIHLIGASAGRFPKQSSTSAAARSGTTRKPYPRHGLEVRHTDAREFLALPATVDDSTRSVADFGGRVDRAHTGHSDWSG